MQRWLVLTGLSFALGCGAGAGDDVAVAAGGPAAERGRQAADQDTAADVARTFGAGVSAGELTPISAILGEPAAWVGKTVRVEGLAVGVCEHRGCWFNLASDQEGETLRFKVTDGEMVFPMELVGERMRAEGVFTANELDLETTKQVCEASAQKAGETFDPAAVTTCLTVYQITGTGAVQLARPD